MYLQYLSQQFRDPRNIFLFCFSDPHFPLFLPSFYSDNSFNTSQSSSKPVCISDIAVASAGLWLIPPILGTKIIAVGNTFPNTIESWPAPLFIYSMIKQCAANPLQQLTGGGVGNFNWDDSNLYDGVRLEWVSLCHCNRHCWDFSKGRGWCRALPGGHRNKFGFLLLCFLVEFCPDFLLPVEELPETDSVLFTPLSLRQTAGIAGLDDTEPFLGSEFMRYFIHTHRLLRIFWRDYQKGDCATKKAMHTVQKLRPTSQNAIHSIAFLALRPHAIIAQGVGCLQVLLIYRLLCFL